MLHGRAREGAAQKASTFVQEVDAFARRGPAGVIRASGLRQAGPWVFLCLKLQRGFNAPTQIPPQGRRGAEPLGGLRHSVGQWSARGATASRARIHAGPRILSGVESQQESFGQTQIPPRASGGARERRPVWVLGAPRGGHGGRGRRPRRQSASTAVPRRTTHSF